MHRTDFPPITYKHHGYTIWAIDCGLDRWAVCRPHEERAFCGVRTLAEAREVIEEDEEDNLKRHQHAATQSAGVQTVPRAAVEA